MIAVETAEKRLTDAVCKGLRLGDGCLPECYTPVNDASRAMVHAMLQDHGQAWLGKINLHSDDDRRRIMWQHEPDETIFTFGAAFVLPCYDAELERLIRERDEAPYTGTRDDAKRIDPILQRIVAIGGVHLSWS